MKKTYINPTIDIIKIVQSQPMLAGSVEAAISGTQGNEDALGRDYDFDDED
ncbi:MAG: hypothetical protein IJ155_01540 [Prevotella sp.]|nr:hypothetical protein [Prevotella sp.]